MKIIFLDFDGVLNDFKLLSEASKRGAHKDGWNHLAMIDPSKVELLNQIVEKTGAKFVVSSTWRIKSSIDELQGYLDHHGFKGEIIDCTPMTFGGFRGREIRLWLEDVSDEGIDVEKFVIVDDDTDMGILIDKLVLTSFGNGEEDGTGGLMQEHVDEIVRRLNS